MKILARILTFILASVLLGTLGLAISFIYLSSQLPSAVSLRSTQLQVPLRIYTQDKQLIAEFGEQKRLPLRFEEIPELLIHALLDTEDVRFYEHSGVDIRGLTRAVLNEITQGNQSQGGSTITMQVARNFFLSRTKTYTRKLNEILLAFKIDKELSKNEILTLYMNKVFFGHRAYGVAAAANVYYGKPH